MAADDEFDEFAVAQPGNRPLRDDMTVSHDHRATRDLIDLVEAVRHVDHADAAVAKGAKHAEQARDVGCRK